MMSLSGISELEKYAQHFCPTLPKTPTGRFASVLLLRETKSYAIFTTEGGEQQDIEQTQAGLANRERIDRLVMFKRKQVAPERRTGKALLRQYGVLPYATLTENNRVLRVVYGAGDIARAQEEVKNRRGVKIDAYEDCYLIAGMCAHCVDCLTYGFAAVGGQGARKARVLTDSCFSVRPYPLITEKKKFNYIDEQTHTSGTITGFDHTKPHTFFPSVVTTVDLTLDEFVYVLNNLLRTSRYGKEVAHLGLMGNHILAIALSDVELFSNLEFSQAFYDSFQGSSSTRMEFGLSLKDFLDHEKQVINTLMANLNGRCLLIQDDALKTLLEQIRALNQDQNQLTNFLRELNRQAASFTV
jgi:CRISPR-associated protein Csc2